MLQGAFDIPQRPEMENPALWKQMSSWILVVPADPPVAVTDACLGKIAALAQDAGKAQRVKIEQAVWDGYCATHALIFLTCFVVYKGFVIYETVLGEMT